MNSTLNPITLSFALAALMTCAAASAQNSFGNAPAAPSRGAPAQQQDPQCPPGQADRHGGCRGRNYNGPVGDYGDPEFDRREEEARRTAIEARSGAYPNDGGGDRSGVEGASQRPATNESQDFGVPVTSSLRPSDKTHGPTPSKIPGGLVVTTDALQSLIGNRQAGAVVLDVYGAPQMLPNAVHAMPAAQGGSFDDETQRGYAQFLQGITGGDKNRPIVTYCAGVQCWLSYNAALRAIKLGYKNVMWYRGGLEAWTQAGLQTVSPPNGQSGDGDQRPQQNPNQVGQRSR